MGLLLARLDEIAASLARGGHALALIGLGSVGKDLARLDAFSDLDFFVIVEPGWKQAFIDDLGWLEAAGPIAFSFRNTADGHKVLFADGVYAEFAVFTPDELAAIHTEDGRVVWTADGVDPAMVSTRPPRDPAPKSAEFLLGELLTNLYVGLTRLRREETLSAMRFIQGLAVDRLVELVEVTAHDGLEGGDPFDPARRVERRRPELGGALPGFLQGYERSAESALAVLAWVEGRFEVNGALQEAIVEAAEVAIGGGEEGGA